MLADVAHIQAFVAGADKQPEDLKPGLVTEGGKGLGGVGKLGHATNITTFLVL